MRTIKTLLFLFFSVTAFAGADIRPAELRAFQSNGNELYWKNRMPHEGYWQQDVYYIMNVSVDDKEESIGGEETLHYWNNSPDTLNRVYFHLYQNAFTPNSYLSSMRKEAKVKTTYGVNEQNMNTVINKVSVNNKPTAFTIDNSIMYIDLPTPLLPNSGVQFDINFKTYWDKDDGGNIRRRMKTFRHGGKDGKDFLHFDGVHWYPRIAVYDRKFGWTTDQHLGKEFYGDYGVFEVSLTFPNQYIVEATGVLQNESEMYPGDLRQRLDVTNFKTGNEPYSNPITPAGSTKTWSFRAVNVHDFAFTADPTYRIGEVVWNGIRCIALAQEEHAHSWHPTAQFVADVVRVYSEKVGMFAYPKMIAADARDGMEYPMLTLDGGSFPGHKGLIAHEVGHNWFFGMVGNNETYRASLDEGFTQFLTAMSQKAIDGVDYRPNYRDDQTVFYGYMAHAIGDNNARLNVHSDHYNSAERHGGGYSQVYYKTATMLYNLQYVLGDELFDAAFKNYFDQWKFCHPYWEDFRSSIIRYTKVDLNWFFDEWLTDNSVIDYKIKSVKRDGDYYEITFERKGNSMPIDFAVVDNAGGVQHYHIPNTYFVKKTGAVVLQKWTGWDMVNKTYTARVKVEQGIKDVVIDPSGRLADVNRLDNAKKLPKYVRYDNLRYGPLTFRHYVTKYRPDIWYNGVDGLKVGAHLNGNYFNTKHKFNATVWYNTGLQFSGTDEATVDGRNLVSYMVDYRNRIAHHTNLNIESRYNAGWMYHMFGIDKEFKAGRMDWEIASANRYNSDYMLYPEFANTGFDNWMKLKFSRELKQVNGNGLLKLTAQAPMLWSDYSYASFSAEMKHNTNLKKILLRTRAFAHVMTGDLIAPEAMLQLSGTNTYDLMDNKYSRAIGWLQSHQLQHGREGNMVHQGGGLNLRGYSGVAATNVIDNDTFFAYAGNSGIAFNAELDFGRFINPRLKGKLGRFIDFNPYLFGDFGILGINATQHSGFRMDAGVGANLALNFNRRWSSTKPLNLRIDLPFFLNRIPEEQSEYVQMRYVIGVNRAF